MSVYTRVGRYIIVSHVDQSYSLDTDIQRIHNSWIIISYDGRIWRPTNKNCGHVIFNTVSLHASSLPKIHHETKARRAS
jgi:hypothetical protein